MDDPVTSYPPSVMQGGCFVDGSTDTLALMNDTSPVILNEQIQPSYDKAVCNICIEQFESQAILKRHIQSIHFGVNSYRCSMCSESFQSKESVNKHYNECKGQTVELDFENSKDYNIDASQAGFNKIISDKKNSSETKTSEAIENKKTKKGSKYIKQSFKSAKKFQREVMQHSGKSPKTDMKSNKNESEIGAINSGKVKLKKNNSMDLTTPKRRSARISKKKIQKKPTNHTSIRTKKNQKKIKQKHESKDIKAITKICSKTNSKEKNTKQALHTSCICYICQKDKIGEFDDFASHMKDEHSRSQEELDSEFSVVKCQMNKDEAEQFMVYKCLRCGIEIFFNIEESPVIQMLQDYLLKMQMHLQFDCIRKPFNNDNTVNDDDMYCTICGKCFENAQNHDIHVVGAHYTDLYDANNSKAVIPQPHILYFRIQRGKIVFHGQYICPYKCQAKSFNSIESLLDHTRFCHKRFGILVLQCNNCFKMILSDNSSEQINKLSILINCKNLQCCRTEWKTFKCYCCNYDFTCDVVTRQLTFSINLIKKMRSGMSIGLYSNEYSSCFNKHPTIHGNGMGHDFNKPHILSFNKSMVSFIHYEKKFRSQDEKYSRNSGSITSAFDFAAEEPFFIPKDPKIVKKTVSSEPLNNEKLGGECQSTCSVSWFVNAGLVCFLCPQNIEMKQKTFYCKEGFVKHMTRHESERSEMCFIRHEFRCYDCNSSYRSFTDWKNHIVRYHPNCVALKCSERNCFMEFQRAIDLQTHIIENHFINEIFECYLCFSKFVSEEDMLSHTKHVHNF